MPDLVDPQSAKVDAFLWVAFPSWWLLPLAGFFVGYITNFLALKLIFEPRQPINILGFEYQGLFIKRQMEFALSFAEVVSEKVLHIQSVLEGNGRGMHTAAQELPVCCVSSCSA